MRRKFLLIGAAVGVLSLVAASIALATGTIQTFGAAFGTKAKGKSSTLTIKLSSTDPTNPRNHAPDPARTVVILLPKGTDIEPKAVPQCSATALQFQQSGTNACPANTKIGTGSATVNSTAPGRPTANGEIPATVTAFNAKNKVLDLYVNPTPFSQPFLITAATSGSKKKGFRLTTSPPPQCIPPGTAAQGCPNGEFPLDSLTLTTIKKSGKVNGKKVGFLSTPTTCPKSKKWKFTARITFKTDGTKSFNTTAPCKR